MIVCALLTHLTRGVLLCSLGIARRSCSSSARLHCAAVVEIRVARRVYVHNLSFKTTWQSLKDYFQTVGHGASALPAGDCCRAQQSLFARRSPMIGFVMTMPKSCWPVRRRVSSSVVACQTSQRSKMLAYRRLARKIFRDLLPSSLFRDTQGPCHKNYVPVVIDPRMNSCAAVVYADVMRDSKEPGARSKVSLAAQRTVNGPPATNPAQPLAATMPASALANTTRGCSAV